MLCFYSGELRHDDISTIVKTKCARIVHKEVDKAVYDDIAWMCGWVMCIALHDNVFSCLNFSFTTQAADGEVREESLFILPNRSVASSHASEMGAKRVSKAYRRKPWAPFSICQLDHFLIFVFKVKKGLSSFGIWHEEVLPFRENVIAFFLLVE